jgi:hypothetical protein
MVEFLTAAYLMLVLPETVCPTANPQMIRTSIWIFAMGYGSMQMNLRTVVNKSMELTDQLFAHSLSVIGKATQERMETTREKASFLAKMTAVVASVSAYPLRFSLGCTTPHPLPMWTEITASRLSMRWY